MNYKYLLVDQQYRLAVLNEVLCRVEYQPDGSSHRMFRQYVENPRGFAFLRVVYMQHPTSGKRLVVDCIHYCSSSFIAKDRKYVQRSPKNCSRYCVVYLGWHLLLTLRKKRGSEVVIPKTIHYCWFGRGREACVGPAVYCQLESVLSGL